MTNISFNQPLTSPNYAALRRVHWQGDQHVSMADNVLVLSANMSATEPTISGGTSAVLPYTLISGTYSNIDEGMVVIVSPTSDPRFGTAVRLRTRFDHTAGVVADSSHIYVSEYSDILGLGSYIFVYYSYDIIDALSRPIGTNPVVQKIDYDHPYQKMAPVITGPDSNPLQTGYAGWVDAAGHFDVVFDCSGTIYPEFGASSNAFLWSVVATTGGTPTVIGGSTTTNTVTYQFTYGEYIVKILVTDSNSVTNFRHILVKAHDPVHYPPNDGFEGVQITRDLTQGPSGTVKFYDGVSTLLNGTWTIVWVDELYSDQNFANSNGSLFGNIDLIGWIEKQTNQFTTDATYSGYSEVSFEIQGVAARLSRIEGQLLAITNSATPTAWDQINKLTPWRAIVHFLSRHTQVLNLCDFNSDNLDETYLFPTITTIAGNALDNVTGGQGIAEQYNAELEFARDGRIQLVRRAPFVTDYVTNLTHVATWTPDDFVGNFTWEFNMYLNYGYLSADGAAWNGTALTPTPVLSRAPGLAQSSGTQQGQLNNQILDSTNLPASAQVILNNRAGTQYAVDNNTGTVAVAFPDGYWWMEASYNQLYVFDIPAEYNTTGLLLDSNTYWICKQFSVRHTNENGSREVSGTFIPVVIGFPGATVPIVNNGSVPPALPPLPPMPAFDFQTPETTIPDAGLPETSITPTGTTVDHNGELVLEVSNNGTALSLAKKYILLASPPWLDITPPLPSGYTLTDACFDQISSTGPAVAVYALATNNTDSIIFYNANVLNGSVAWTQTGTPFVGVYTLVRATYVPGTAFVYTPSPTTNVTTIDLKATNGGFVNVTYSSLGHPTLTPDQSGAWSSGGWKQTAVTDSSSGGVDYQSILVGLTFGSAKNLIKVVWTFNRANGMNLAGLVVQTFGDGGSSGFDQISGDPGPQGTDVTYTWKGSSNVDRIIFDQNCGSAASPTSPGGTCTLTKVQYTEGSGNSNVRVTTDFGATVSSILDQGSSVGGLGGFDFSRASTISYAAANNEVNKATTYGGAYSAFATLGANPASIVIPYYQVGSNVTTQTASSTPQSVVGLDAEVAGTCFYWLDGSGTPTAITTPASGAICPGPDCITMLRGKKMAVIVNVGGVFKLYVTENLVSGGTATWTFVKNVDSTATLRSRRNDTRNAAHKGQLYLFDTPSGYSSKWANASEWPRVSPSGSISSGDVLG